VVVYQIKQRGYSMKDSLKTMFDELGAVFAEMDSVVLANTIDWANKRAAQIAEYKALPEYRKLNAYDRAYKVIELAGSSAWSRALVYGTDESRVKYCKEYCEAVIANRNAKMVKKLDKAGVENVLSSSFTHTRDGFNGVFEVNTDKGNKIVEVQTIYAGGYNVQCAHLRVLTKIR
jgi:hypothetical protein